MAPAAKWEDGEVTVLITIYGEHFASLEKMAKKKPIYVKMAEKLKEQGYNRSDKQVAKKISNLREEYKKRCPGPTGDETPDWIHFQALHKILHERPALNSSVAVTSEIGLEDEADNIVSGIEEKSEEGPGKRTISPIQLDEASKPKKARPVSQSTKIAAQSLEFMKTQANKRDEERQELKKTNEALVSALNRIANSSESIAESLKSGSYSIIHSDM